MFGDLFEEETTEGIIAPPVHSVDPAPPNPRLPCKFAGINNQGATCYLNSLLQTLLLTPEFKENLFKLCEKDLGSLEDKDTPEAKVRVIPIQLQRLFAQLLLSNQQSVSTLDLTNSFGWTNQEGFQQHDVQELNRILFCAIEDSLIGTPGQNAIKELYRGKIVNQIKCLQCKKVSEREEDFLDLTVAVAGMPGVEAALKSTYCDVEVMNGCNQYRCETCGILTDATKGAKLRNLPPILTISLLRFSYDFVKMSRYKENGRFTFPMQLDMSPYADKKCTRCKEDNLYDLFSVVVHRGGAYGGHYFAYIRDIDCLGHWTNEEPSKKQSKKANASTGLDIIECESPVDLIETILSKASHGAMSVDRLCGEISKVTGVSWNKRFKKSHGPINKFLRSNGVFSYNSDSNWVSLASTNSSDPSPSSSSPQSPQEDAPSSAKDCTSPNLSKDPQTPESPPGHQWFCFNDSSVSPIVVKEIERQFSGKESAYMLFYRRHSLHRPTEAQGQPAYAVPERLVQEVDAINDNLLQQRSVYDFKTNSINLSVYGADQFIYREMLHLKDEEGPKQVTIDRRRTVTELRKVLDGVIPDKCLENLNIHVIREWCGGFYLCEELKDRDTVLQDLNISSATCLLVWNGSLVDDQFVEEGSNQQPLKLLIISEAEQLPLGEIMLRRSRSLNHLYTVVAELAGLDVNQITLCAGTNADSSAPRQPFPRDSCLSLMKAGLANDEVILVSSDCANIGASSDNFPVTLQEPDWSLTIVDHLTGAAENSITLKMKSSVGLKELKVQALEEFDISTKFHAETVRLREDHSMLGLQPPLREGLSLQDSGLSNHVTLVLENGRPPQDSEMTVSVNKMEGSKLVQRREFLIDRQLTVDGMLRAACQLMDCHGDSQWYLSKTDMYGDPAEPLDNDSASLLDLFINDGDTLVLQEGSIVRKDQVRLNVWLHTDLDESVCSNHRPGDRGDNPTINGENEEDKIMLELAVKLSVEEAVDPQDLNPLNKCLYPKMKQLFDKSLIVNKGTSIGELKLALMKTECFQNLRIPTSYFMRLRVMEGKRLQAVIRDNSQVLRHVNPKEALNVAVQILPWEENLGNHQILLNVAQKIGGSRIYMPAKEFAWNTSAGQGAVDLRKAVASQLGLAVHDVAIAKYNPDNCTWTVIKDAVQKPAKGKGKKKSGSGKCNIRQAPYYVQDGDLIGVKVISSDKGTLDAEDFNTQEDIEKQLLLKQIAEEKRRMREQKKNDNWMDEMIQTNASKHRTEVPLTIKVENFS